MKNIHTRLFAAIIVLLAGAIYVVATQPARLGLDIRGGMRVVLAARTQEYTKGKWTPQMLETLAGMIRNRVDSLGVNEPVIYTKPTENQIVVELPGIKDKDEALETLKRSARLEFRYVQEIENGEWSERDEKRNGQPTGFMELVGRDGAVKPEELEAKVFSKPADMTGDDLEPNSKAEITPKGTVIHFEFKPESKARFEEFTRIYLHKRFSIFLDRKLISAPRINDVIPGEGIIEGRFTPEQAKLTAEQLNKGALPVSLAVEAQYSVEATLGQAAVRQTLIAGVVGLVAVLIFMVAYYGMPGLLADLALVLYTIFSLAIFKGALGVLGLPGVTMTVPGIAGFILSIGMAVDANVLIFERLKEERNAGKSIRSAIEAGFKRAFSAIFDSNMCTLITCAILYHFGTGLVRGFAVTLAIGVIVSMFTAITCSRTFLLMLAGTPAGQKDSLYQLNRGLRPTLGVTKRMGFWFGLSGAIILPGLVFWLGLSGTKYSIEFTGGSEVLVSNITESAVRTALSTGGIKEFTLVAASKTDDHGARTTMYSVTTPGKTDEARSNLVRMMRAAGGSVERAEVVSGSISAELKKNAIQAVLLASVFIVLYLTIRFSIGGLVEGLKFGVCAIVATLHDVLVVWGIFAILGFTLGWQVDSLFVTALLTVIGFSTHDTIVIFDRIRENLKHKARGESFAEVTDRSIDQTFARSVNTSLTVAITLVALLALGGPVTRVFVGALLLGVISGTYSSIFNASPLLVLWRRLSGDRGLATAAAGVGGARPQPATRVAPASAPRNDPAQAPKTETDSEASKAARSTKRKRRM